MTMSSVTGNRNVSCFTHHQRSDAEQVRHEGDIGALAALDVEGARIVDRACEAITEVEGFGLCGRIGSGLAGHRLSSEGWGRRRDIVAGATAGTK